MKVASIKKAVESYTIDQLQSAEKAVLEEQTPNIEIEGTDDGEKLTHILAAVFIKDKMKNEGLDYTSALRLFSQRVRTSIS